MRPSRISSIPAALVLAAGLVLPVLTSVAQGAEVSEFGTPNPEYLEQKAELEKLISAHAAHVGGGLSMTSACPPSDAPPCSPTCCRLP